MNLTTQQLAEILIGIARTQQAIIEAIESSKAGFKGTHLAPALDSVAKIRSTGRPLSLQDFPARVLLQCQGRAGPNIGQMVRDLEELLAGTAGTPSTVAPATARAAAAQSAAGAQTARPAPVPSATPPEAAAASPSRPAPAAAPATPDDLDLDMTK